MIPPTGRVRVRAGRPINFSELDCLLPQGTTMRCYSTPEIILRAEPYDPVSPMKATMLEVSGWPAPIPETRFHFKTEVLRFGRVGCTCISTPGNYPQIENAANRQL